MHTPVVLRRALGAVIVLLAAAAFHQALGAGAPAAEAQVYAAAATPPPTPAAYPAPQYVQVGGLPAISASGGMTREAVTQFVTAHPVPPGFVTSGTPKLSRLELLSSAAVTKLLLGEPTGLPDTAMVYFVVEQGSFTVTSPMGKATTYPVGYDVFDATTGNLIMDGGLSATPQG